MPPLIQSFCAVFGGLTTDRFAHSSPGSENTRSAGWNSYLLTRPGVSSGPFSSLTNVKNAEPYQRDFFFFFERIGYYFENGIHSDISIFLLHARSLRNCIYQFRFRHTCHPLSVNRPQTLHSIDELYANGNQARFHVAFTQTGAAICDFVALSLTF